MKTLQDLLIAHSSGDAGYAKRLAKILDKNGIDSIDRLMAMDPREIQGIKGVGDRALTIIGRALTEERSERENKKDIYDKYSCKDTDCSTLRDWFVKAGTSYHHASLVEQILKANGINTIKKFMETDISELSAIKGIAVKRIELIRKTRGLIEKKSCKAKKR